LSGSRSASWRLMSLATRLVIAIAVAAALGFPFFVWSLARDPVEPQKADGIVVLTGGEDRLPAAVKLLQAHKGTRLLISGVHHETTREQLLERVGGDAASLSPDVDLGRSAGNTIGNADETAAWATENKYDAIIVVTASYHMPRALLELEAASPEVRFVAYPVFPEKVKMAQWWSDPQTTGVLIAEYGKYLAAFVRVNAVTTFGMKPAAVAIEHGSKTAATPPVSTPSPATPTQSAGAQGK
jgi:uncharacterized SAM-binding protein YcdF (DUF218 family)